MQNIGKFYIKTFGCQMNEYDSQKINNILYKLGYTKTSLQTDADISLINTCHIRNKAKEKLAKIEKLFSQKLSEQIKKRNKLAEIKIEQIVRDTNLQIQNYIVQNAIKTTVLLLEKKLDQNEKQKLINDSISELNIALKH